MALLDNVKKEVNAVAPGAARIGNFMKDMKTEEARKSLSIDDLAKLPDEELDEEDIALLNSYSIEDEEDDGEIGGDDPDEEDISSEEILKDINESAEDDIPEPDDDDDLDGKPADDFPPEED